MGFIQNSQTLLSFLAVLVLFICSPIQAAQTTTSHGYAQYGDLKYPADFQAFDYVNPAAPKGGSIRLMAHGTFDTLNPYTLKGLSPVNSPGLYIYGISELNEPLMVGSGGYAPSGDEAASAYGLIAESVEYPADQSWVIFHLREQAHFHDGHPIDSEDVVFSFETLITSGHPRYRDIYRDVDSVTVLDKRRVKFTFKPGAATQSLILRVGELPVLPEHYWKNKDFSKTTLEPPLLSGPYKVAKVDAGHSLTFERISDYWGKDLPVNKGRYNFDQVNVDFYRDLTVALEAFKSDEYDIHLEYISKNWHSAYNFPALKKGKVIKREIPHQIPSGSQAFFFNTRRAIFSDIRVREAIGYLFDFEWTNKNIFNDAYQRSLSYYPNAPFSATNQPQNEELALLTPFQKQLPSALFEQEFTLPVNDGHGHNRGSLRKALALLKEAGWTPKEGKLINSRSEIFQFEILGSQASMGRVVLPFIQNLKKVGIEVNFRTVDPTVYKTRLDQFDFDMTVYVLPQGLTPGAEQYEYFSSETASVEGSRNYAGIANPVVDQLIEQLLHAKSRSQLNTTIQALDRVLLWNHYSIPHWHLNFHRVAYWDIFGQPAKQPDYDLGFSNWWYQP